MRFVVRAAGKSAAGALFAAGARPALSFDAGFAFSDVIFEGLPTYRGKWLFKRHLLGPDRVPVSDGRDDGEELRCAQALDSLAGVEFCVRNVAGHASAFWLPTVTGRTYPDFVAKLTDVACWSSNTRAATCSPTPPPSERSARCGRPKRGQGVYTMDERERDALDMRAQLMAAIG